MTTTTPLKEINPDSIKPNPENPRLIFREEEMSELLESIREVGIKVPLSVYPEGKHYVLLDGERRWRCAKKLNLDALPAIIHPKPSRLENLLMMFNIHNVRVDWDLMPMAYKLGDIQKMLIKEKKLGTAKELAAVTGVRLPTVKRALELLNMPEKYKKMLMKEAEKPRREQKVTADVFIEVYKSMHTIERHSPEVFEKVKKDQYVDSMVGKYINGVIDNVVDYRDIGKIARGENKGADKKNSTRAIVKLVTDNTYNVKDAFKNTVESSYKKHDLILEIKSISKLLKDYSCQGIDKETRNLLSMLRDEIDCLLGR